MAAQPREVAAYRGGKVKLMGFFVGEVMKATRGQANPKTVNETSRGRSWHNVLGTPKAPKT